MRESCVDLQSQNIKNTEGASFKRFYHRKDKKEATCVNTNESVKALDLIFHLILLKKCHCAGRTTGFKSRFE